MRLRDLENVFERCMFGMQPSMQIIAIYEQHQKDHRDHSRAHGDFIGLFFVLLPERSVNTITKYNCKFPIGSVIMFQSFDNDTLQSRL